jgi:CSLREA domain-containing protein
LQRAWFLSIWIAGAASAAGAAPTFVVNSLVDAPASANVADGVCETGPGNGVCTLRAAVMEANAVVGGGAHIEVPAGVYLLTHAGAGEDAGASGDLDITSAVTIDGKGPGVTIVDGLQYDRVLSNVATGASVRGLTLRNGLITPGPGISNEGGGIKNVGSLTLENVAVSAMQDAGILNSGVLELRHSIVQGSLYGGIRSTGTLRVTDSIVRSNGATGVDALGGDTRIERSLISYNGAGVYSQAALVILNSTVTSNATSGGDYAGIAVYSGSTQLVNVTITDNVTDFHDPGVYVLGGSVFIKNSVVAGNRISGIGPKECTGSLISGDYNLIGTRSTCNLSGALGHVNATDIDPNLFPVKPNGGFGPDQGGFGPTIDAIPVASCTDELGAPLLVDQRGYRRDGPCDIGAHEVSGSYAPAVLRGVELLRNGGAEGNELGSTDGAAIEQPPYWATTSGSMTQINYGLAGGYPLAAEAPAGSGRYFFEGGDTAFSGGEQLIDISALASEIDAGQVPFTVSGAFGGFSTDGDSAALTLLFYSDAGQFGSIAIGGFSAADRGNLTGLLPESKSGFIPAGARSIDVTLEMTRTNGARNDGYADNLSLVLPEPSDALLGGCAMAAILSLRARSTRRCRRLSHRNP